jgi:PAS domain S-box-containing protein
MAVNGSGSVILQLWEKTFPSIGELDANIENIEKTLQAEETLQQVKTNIAKKSLLCLKDKMILEGIINSVPAAIFQYRMHHDENRSDRHEFTFMSRGIYDMQGIRAEEAMQDLNKVMVETVLPEDLPGFLASIEASRLNFTPWHYEYRVLDNSNQIRWLRGNSLPIFQDKDSTVWNGILLDVTAEKEAEAKWLKATKEARDLQYALDQSSIVVMTDANGRITYVNDQFCEISGYSRQELIGQTHNIVNSAYHPPSFFKELWLTISQGKIWRGEIRNQRKNGEFYWVNTTIVPFIDQKTGKPFQYLAIRNDITDWKKQQLMIAEAKELFQSVFQESPDALFLIEVNTQSILDCNHRSLRMFAVEHRHQLIEQGIYAIDGSNHYNVISHVLNNIAVGDPLNLELELITATGKKFWGSLATTKVNLTNKNIILLRITDITARRLEKNKLEESESRLRVSLEAGKIVCWQANLKTNMISGIGELNQNKWFYKKWLISIEESLQKIHIDDCRILSRKVFRRAKREQQFIFEHYLKHSCTWILLSGQRILDDQGNIEQIVGAFIDITEEKAQKAILEFQQNQLETIISHTAHGLLIVDQLGKISFANPAASSLLNRPLKKILNHDFGIPFQETSELEVLKPEGLIFLEMKSAMTKWMGETVYVVSLQDITARKRQSEILAEAKQIAEKANQAKSIFLANMSHELRSPLNAILGFTQLLSRDHNLMVAQKKKLEIINHSGDHLLNLINDILDLVKIENGLTEINATDFNLKQMLDEIYELFKLRAWQKSIRFTFDINGVLVNNIRADHLKIRQILINLISNAIKYTDQGEVNCLFRTVIEYPNQSNPNNISQNNKSENNISQGHNSQAKYLFLATIKDTGSGIAPAEMTQIFTPFVQASSGNQSQVGTGLGLAITEQHLRLLGGEKSLESVLGEGTTFSVSIPIEPIEQLPLHSQSIDPKIHINLLIQSDQTYRILIVDDIATNIYLVKELIAHDNFVIAEASNGWEAVQQDQQFRADLILMDIKMPVMDGLQASQLIRQARTQQGMDHPQIVALTASAFVQETAKILKLCDGIIIKPFHRNKLILEVARQLGLQYEYEKDDIPVVKQHQEITVDSLRCLPVTWLKELEEAVLKLDHSRIRQLIQNLDSNYEDFRPKFLDIVETFNYEYIISLLDQLNISY